MLVVNGNRPSMSGAERAVVAWLRKVPGPGIALSGYHIPGRDGRDSQEIDLVLITPTTVAALEIKGIVKYKAGGTLSCPVNGRWTLSGLAGDPIHVRNTDTNPLDQVGAGMWALKNVCERSTGREVFISGLVLIVPNNAPLQLDKGMVPMPKGRDVILGDDRDDLEAWLYVNGRRPQIWTAELVSTVLEDLGLADTVDSDALLAEGFPAQTTPETTGAGVVVDLFPATPHAEPPQAITSQRPRQRPVTPRKPPEDLGRTGSAEHVDSEPLPLYLSPGADLRSGRHAPVRSAILAGAALCLLGGGIWVIASAADHPAHHGGGHQPGAVIDPRTSPAAAPPPAAPPAGPPAPLFTAPAATKPCYPFQPDC